jgi:hypothetical protein
LFGAIAIADEVRHGVGQRSGWEALCGFGIRSLEDLPTMPADVLKLHDRLAGPGRNQRLAREPVHGLP